MSGVKFTIDDNEKIGVIGRNGVGKSTLFGILTVDDKDFTGDVKYKRGTVSSQPNKNITTSTDETVLQYVLLVCQNTPS